MKKNTDSTSIKPAGILLPVILITACFALWGFANDITNPMVKAFSKIFRMSVSDGTLVQVAFYGGYFAMAVPAAMFIRRYTYKSGVMLGLGLYAAGALMFLPAKETGLYYPFLLAYFILTCGLSFLETSCNPYIMAIGPKATAIRRLNMAQAFNPIGSLAGMYVAMNFIQDKLNPLDSVSRAALSDDAFQAVKESDLGILIEPYLWIGLVIIVLLTLIRITRMPSDGDDARPVALSDTLRRLLSTPAYREGVVAQFFYVGAQIMCWTFIIQYGTRVFMAEGMTEQAAEVLSQQYNIVAMVIFCSSRFVCTWLMRYVNPARLLAICAIFAAAMTSGVIFLDGRPGIYCLVGVSAGMSLMFPTIYGLALRPLSTDDAKIGASGLIMAILGGSVLPAIQAAVIDAGDVMGIPGINASFVLPLICFAVVLAYAVRCKPTAIPQ